MKRIRESESGQVLLILAVGIVGLLGFAALAIDGGMFYSDRRFDQNAADASAFAGGGAAGNFFVANDINYSNFNCAHDENYVYADTATQAVVDAAIAEVQSRAGANNFGALPAFDTEAELIASGHGVWVACVIDGTYLGDKYLEVHVMITSQVQTSFAHMFFGGEMSNTVEAVTKVEVPEGVGRGLAIVALDYTGCGNQDGGLFFGGDGNIVIHDSGAHSNTCLVCSGASLIIDSEDDLSYMMGEEDTKCKKESIVGEGQLKVVGEGIDPYDLVIDCGNRPQSVPKKDKDNNIILQPGNYENIRVNDSKVTLILEPGLYCVKDEITVNGEGIIVAEHLFIDPDKDDGVTIYAIGGAVTFNGSSVVDLRAPRSDPLSTPPASLSHAHPPKDGMLIYVDPNNTKNTVTLNGGTLTYYRGTVYNPLGIVKINGNSENDEWLAQLIANEIIATGTDTLNIFFNGEDVYWGSAFIGLEK